MSHQTPKSFLKLQKRLDKFAQGAPESESLIDILKVLFDEEEAAKTSQIPIKPFTVETMMKRWKVSEEEAQKELDNLADKGILFDLYDGQRQTYVMAPTMAGFFEFSLMRTDGKFDTKVLSELYHQYINEEDDFITEALMQKTPIARTLVHETSISMTDQSEIMDYERATEVINTASACAVGTCYCRHKMEHADKACDKPQDVCLTFNNAAKTLSKHGIAKKITKEEAHGILKNCIDLGLVQVGDNTQNNVGWI